MFYNSRERNKFIHTVTQIRDRLAHGLYGDEAFNYNYETLLSLTNKLKIIVESAILHELGFDKKVIDNFVERRSRESSEWELITFW